MEDDENEIYDMCCGARPRHMVSNADARVECGVCGDYVQVSLKDPGWLLMVTWNKRQRSKVC